MFVPVLLHMDGLAATRRSNPLLSRPPLGAVSAASAPGKPNATTDPAGSILFSLFSRLGYPALSTHAEYPIPHRPHTGPVDGDYREKIDEFYREKIRSKDRDPLQKAKR